MDLDMLKTTVSDFYHCLCHSQLATALEVLKLVGIIHTDIHIYNIMLVDHRSEPLTFKLIDYGLAITSSKVQAELGKSLQPNDYR